MNIFESTSYRENLKGRVSKFKKEKPGTSLKKLSPLVPVQYTYLSKALNNEDTHLTEDQLFRLAELLEFESHEIEYLMLLRTWETANSKTRKRFVYEKIEGIRKKEFLEISSQPHEKANILDEISYLFDPVTLLVHVALDIKEYFDNPLLLCGQMAITKSQIIESLEKLHVNGIIELDNHPYKIKRFAQGKLHFGRDHPLMRVHQNLIKTMIHSQIMRTDEEHKHSFLATFNSDAEGFAQIKAHFNEFLEKARKTVEKSKNKHVYQLSFDLFRWF